MDESWSFHSVSLPAGSAFLVDIIVIALSEERLVVDRTPADISGCFMLDRGFCFVLEDIADMVPLACRQG